MSLEFIIERSCSFKSEYEHDLLYILDLMQKTYLVGKLPGLLPEEYDEEELKGARVNSGSEKGNQTLGEIEQYLKEHKHCAHCPACPANSSGLDYGCYNRMSYPISESFEREIMGNLPCEGTFAYELLLKAIKDYPIIAAKGLKDFRRKGFTEKKASVQRVLRKKTFLASEKISSDFFLHLLFFSGDLLEVSHMTVLLLFWGIIPHNTTNEDFKDNEYINSQIRQSLMSNQFSHLPESSLIRSMCLSVLINEPLALLL